MKNKGKILTTILTILISVFLVAGIILAVTTIGTNISTDGNLSVTGTSTLTGNTTIAGTLGVTGATTLSSLTATGTISLPNDSITDAMVVDTLTASNYLPLAGGTVTGALNVSGNANFDSNTLFVDATKNDVGIGAVPDQDWGRPTLDVNGSIILGDFGDFSDAGGMFDVRDTSWLNLVSKRIYTLNGLRSDGDIVIDAPNAVLTIPAGALSDGSVLTADIADDAITGAKLWNNIRVGTVSVDPPSIAATTSATFTVTLTAASTDKIILISPSTIEAGLIFQGANITATDTVTIRMYDYTTGPIDGVASTWAYTLFE